VTWWCASSELSWTWAPRAYPGIWIFMLGVAIFGVVAARRHGGASTRQRALWWAGLLALWVATDWPLGALGAGYLASAHMLQYLLYTFVAAPLLVLSVPERLARQSLSGGLVRPLAILSRPLLAGVLVNVVLVATHAPITVDALRTSQAGSFGMDLLWLAGGLILWLPICGPLPEQRPSYIARGAYLFLAAGVIPMIPGGFLTFADFPLYRLYELAPRVGSISAITDQQLAGALMKVGNLPLVWPVIGAMFWRAAQQERQAESAAPGLAGSPAGVGVAAAGQHQLAAHGERAAEHQWLDEHISETTVDEIFDQSARSDGPVRR
jgi:putative membrane protein